MVAHSSILPFGRTKLLSDSGPETQNRPVREPARGEHAVHGRHDADRHPLRLDQVPDLRENVRQLLLGDELLLTGKIVH